MSVHDDSGPTDAVAEPATSTSPTHPAIELIRAFLADAHLLDGPIADQRSAMDAAADGAPAPDGIAIEPSTLGGRPVEWLCPEGVDRQSVVLYLHGGGYCSGSLNSHRGLAGRIALASGCAVVSLDYRLAPEHPLPAALDDALAAYHQLLDDGFSPAKLAIAGDSAGGGLAMATVLALRDEGTALPAAVACLSPWVDLTQSASSYERVGSRDPMVSKEGLDQLAEAYLGGCDPRDERASPLLAADLSGLPPLRIDVGELEVLLDDARNLAERTRSAGSEVTFVEWPGMIHVFQAFPSEMLPESNESVLAIGRFLATQLGLTSDSDARLRG